MSFEDKTVKKMRHSDNSTMPRIPAHDVVMELLKSEPSKLTDPVATLEV